VSNPAETRHMSAAEYLAWEREQFGRHEFDDGEVFAMAGGSPRHNALGAAVITGLHRAMLDRGCRVLTSDQKISIAAEKRYVYADGVVVCGRMQMAPGTTDVITNPSVVVEVLSGTTEGYDRGAKWEAYQTIGSLTDYVLVSQRATHVEHYRRESDGSWRYRSHGAGEVVTLANGVTMLVDAIYEGAFDLQGDEDV
jgi:Uma2 family endonuclease